MMQSNNELGELRRRYACAALSGICSILTTQEIKCLGQRVEAANGITRAAWNLATRMVEHEIEIFGGQNGSSK